MPLPSANVLSSPAPVLRRWTVLCTVLIVLCSMAVLVFIILRKRLGVPSVGWFRLLPLALSLTPVLVIVPLWWWRTAWLRRAVRASGWRLCTHCAYDLSTLERTGICPECGEAYDVDKDAVLWEEAGVSRPTPKKGI